jgi:serine/threonine protein phosphatase PrpC
LAQSEVLPSASEGSSCSDTDKTNTELMHTELVADATTYSVVTTLSHVGLIRDHNEDSLVVGQWTLCAAETEAPQTFVFPPAAPLVVTVADGLGGHPGGDVASSLVVRELARAGPTLDSEQRLRDVLNACNRALYGIAEDQPILRAMGTTVAGVLLTSDQVMAFNVGDSRVYMHGPDALRQVSVDDRPAPAASEKRSAIVTQTLGGGFTYADVEPHVSTFTQSTNVRWLICSDGLSDLVRSETVSELLEETDDSRAAFELWKAAIEAGGHDNITLTLVRVVAESTAATG